MKKWFIANMPLFLRHFATSMATVSTIVTVVVSIWQEYNCPCVWKCSLLISLLYAVCRIHPAKKISVNFIQKRSVELKQGDLFSIKKGIVVIPVNNYFDTQLERDVVGAGTLHGLFIKFYKEHYPDSNIDTDIDNALSNDGIPSIGETSNRKNVLNERKKKYELGTIARVQKGDIQYYLVVATEFDGNNHVIRQPEKFPYMLMNMLKNIDTYNSGHPVYMPIIGSGQSGYNLTKQEIITQILQCIKLSPNYATVGGTTILIHEKDMEEISLNKIDYEFNLF